MDSIQSLIMQQVKVAGQRIAIEDGKTQLTYAELDTAANHIAEFLTQQGANKGTLIGIFLERGYELIVQLLSCLKIGAIFIPLDPNFPDGRLELMLSIAEPKWLIVNSHQAQRLIHMVENLGLDEVNIGLLEDESGSIYSSMSEVRSDLNIVPIPSVDLKNTASKLIVCEAALTPEDPCYIFFTSGSTGKPKGILGCYKGLLHFITWEIDTFGIDSFQRVSHFTTPSFDAMLRDIFVPLVAGGTICIPEEQEIILDPKRLIHWIEQKHLTLVHCVPSLFRRILSEIQSDEEFPTLRYILMAGERILPADVLRWFNIFAERIQLVNLYGASETTMIKLFHPITKKDCSRTNIPIGKPMKGAKAILLDQDMNICPPGVIGEIYIRTPYMTLGYYKNPEKTREVFVPNPFSTKPDDLIYKTGDLGRSLPDGNLEYIGRSDQQVKIRGVRVELGEIESVLSSYPGIKEVAVTTFTDIEDENYPVAYLTLHEKTNERDESVQPRSEVTKIHQYLQRFLPEYMIPSNFIILKYMPLTPTGKIDRKALPEPESIQEDRGVEYVAPSTPIEVTLAEIFTEVLKKEPIGIHDNFFILGGHSLNATRVISRIYQRLLVQIPLRQFFHNSTIAELATLIHHLQQNKYTQIEAQPLQAFYPLSHGQRRLWVISQMGKDFSSAYNLSTAFIIKGQLDITAFEKAFQYIVQRHETLRTYFSLVEGEPVQFIADTYTFKLDYYATLSELNVKHQTKEEFCRCYINEEAAKTFDLRKPGLFRASLIRLQSDQYLFSFTIHHIIADGWSLNLLITELCTIYNGLITPTAFNLPELRIQYHDFALWQQQMLNEGALKEQRTYWQSQFSGKIPVLTLPTDYPRPAVHHVQGERLHMHFHPTIQHNLHSMAKHKKTTLFAILFTAYNLLLNYYSGQDELIVGIPIHGRADPDLENLIGFFVNTLAIKTTISNKQSFEQLLSSVQHNLLNAFDHQDYPFDQLVKELQLPRDLNRSPLFDTMFVLQNTPDLSENAHFMSDLQLQPLTQERKTSRFDITLNLLETENGLVGTIEYSTALFKQTTIERLSQHFNNLLLAIIANPAEILTNFEIMSPEEKTQLIQFSNGPRTDKNSIHCLHYIVEHWAVKHPTDSALILGNEHLTYNQLNSAANQLAYELQLLGVQLETPVALLFKRSFTMIISMLAVLKAGGVYVPIAADYPQERIAFMLEDTEAMLILTQADLTHIIPTDYIGNVLITEYPLRTEKQDSYHTLPQVSPHNLAYIIYTSGSTGRPKGVMIEHRNIVNTVQWKINHYPYNRGDRIIQLLSFAFDGAQSEIWVTLAAGLTLVLPDLPNGYESTKLIEEINQQQINHFTIVPSLYKNLLGALDKEPLQTVITITLGGEQVTEALWQQHNHTHSQILLTNEYGPTEAAVNCTCFNTQQNTNYRGVIPIGKPITNAQVYILDTKLNMRPIGLIGEIYISGSGVARGYLNRPDLTTEKFLPDPYTPGQRMYKTGDLGRYLEDGNIQFVGRNGTQIKMNGYRIELSEIEVALCTHRQIQNAIVLERESSNAEKYLAAYVVPAVDSLTQAELQMHLAKTLPEYMIPKVIFFIDSLPVTPAGKIDYPALLTIEFQNQPDYLPPENNLETALAQIWSEVLGVKPVGRNQNFFALGGHSLRATHIMARITQELGFTCSMELFFTAPTIAEFAKHLAQKNHLKNISPISKEPTHDSCLLRLRSGTTSANLFCIHPGGGGTRDYLELSQQLHPFYTIYGIRARGLFTDERLPKTLDEMIKDYITAIKAIQPTGPYQLLGHSLGGNIAYEITRHLEASGEKVSHLILLDTHSFTYFKHLPPIEAQLKAMILTDIEQLGITPTHNIDEMSIKDIITFYFIPNNLKYTPYSQLNQKEIEHLYKVRKNILQIMEIPESIINTNITFFKAADSRHRFNPQKAWQKWTNGNVTITKVPGNHYSMLKEGNVNVLAELLNKVLSVEIVHSSKILPYEK